MCRSPRPVRFSIPFARSAGYGPEGMKLGADGELTWGVPAAAVGQEAAVILSVSDASGKDTFHTFRLAVVAPPAAKP